MMSSIVAHKWAILITLEALFWIFTVLMLFARYKLGSKRLFYVGAGLSIATGIIPQIALGILNWLTHRELDTFTLGVILLIVYGLTLGRKDIKKLDAWAQRKFAAKRETE